MSKKTSKVGASKETVKVDEIKETDEIKELEACTGSMKLFTIKGKYKGKIVKVHDGDTVHCVIKYNNCLQKFVIRLDNIDTAELNSKDIDKKAKALEARDELAKMILNKIVDIQCNGFDKYGRLLGIIYYNDECINEKIIKLHLGVEYHGGTKEK